MRNFEMSGLKIIGMYEKINCKVKDKIGWELTEVIFLLGCFFSAIMMVIRAFFGTEFTDEAYTVSDALAVMHGNIPYTYNSIIAVGMSFVPIIFYKIYEFFIPDLEGIFLYSRLTFILFRFCIIIGIYHLLKKELVRKWRLLVAGILIPFVGAFSGAVIPNWGYNATSIYVTLLVVFLLYTTLQEHTSERKHYFKLMIGGFLTAVAVFAHSGYAIAVFVFIFLIYSNARKGEKIKSVSFYCIGGILEIFVVLIPIIIQSGLSKFIYGVETMLSGSPEGYIQSTVYDRVEDVIWCIKPGWILLVCSTIFIYCVGKIFIRAGEKKLSSREYWLLAVGCGILISIILAPMVDRDFFTFMGSICMCAFLLLLPIYNKWSSLAWYLGIYNVFFIIVMTISTLTGDRFYYCIPILIPILILLFKEESELFKYVAAAIAIIAIIFQGYNDYKDVYRDNAITQLTAKVESGVYRGIYTTPDRAKNLVELEHYLDENIREDESVSFRDNAPVAYLMRNTNICDVRTWDAMQWSYGCDDPIVMYRYYKNKEQIPDVIAYIDFGRDDSMSIENSSDVFQYNDFVNKFYYLDKNDFKNNTFRVLIYRNNGTFDGDFDRLIESISNSKY